MREVKVNNPTYKKCDAIAFKHYKKYSFDEIVADPDIINTLFIVKDLSIIRKELDDLYDSLPVRLPMDYTLKGHTREMKASLTNNGITYDNYMAIDTGHGSLYFVEEK